ncbi:MAG: hypothetical protein HYZ42_07810, partial [Bacteroidetes bacterium]|nr:hypothetical protein [Bacteroidota bacterium]
MKKNSLLTLVVLMAALTTLNSCKRGDNDPFLSLRGRDGRLKGAWTLSAVSGKYTKTTTAYN